MLTREKLERMSEEELETLYQQKKAEFDQKVGKNRRVRGLLSRKLDEKQNSVANLKNQISDLLEANPDLKLKYNSLTGELKQGFDDIDQDPTQLRELIQETQKTLSQLQSKRLQIERIITETSNYNKQQKSVEEELNQEIALLISKFESLSDITGRPESLELNQLSLEFKSAQDELSNIAKEIEDLRVKIHQQG
ncbi:MAG: hypothetical protein ACFFB5_20165 [Promethearchaeota archaeon]